MSVTVKRFPSIAARLRRGLFWYYLQEISEAPAIREEYEYPLVFMSKEEMRTCAFRIIVYKNRIAAEFFHSLTDGTGALIFLKTLTAEYLERKHGISIPCEHGVLSRTEHPSEEELEDCFPKYASNVRLSRNEKKAWLLSGEKEPDSSLHLVCFRLQTDEVLAKAHEYGATVTAFLGAILMKALAELQKEKVRDIRKRKEIKLLIPVNLRPLFPSRTLRNFAMFTVPEINPKLGDYSFEETINIVKHKMGLEVTAKHMSSVIAANVKDELNPILRIVPLPIKNAVMKAVFDSVGERQSCLAMSNLGRIQLPDIMYGYIKRFDFILGVQADSPYNCGVVSYGDTLYVNFIRNIKGPELERHFFAVLHNMGLCVTAESNKN